MKFFEESQLDLVDKFDDGFLAEQERLVSEIRKRDALLQTLIPVAREKRLQRTRLYQQCLKRTDELEARLLAAHVVPFEEDAIHAHHPHQCDHLMAQIEADRIRRLKEADEKEDAIEEDPGIDETVARYGPGARLVDVHRVDGLEAMLLWKKMEEAKRSEKGPSISPQRKPQSQHVLKSPIGTGQIVKSNAWFTSSPYHPVCKEAFMGQMSHVYPITHPNYPLYRRNLLDDPLSYKPKSSYEAPVDFLEMRRFPPVTQVSRPSVTDRGFSYDDVTWWLTPSQGLDDMGDVIPIKGQVPSWRQTHERVGAGGGTCSIYESSAHLKPSTSNYANSQPDSFCKGGS